MTALWCPWFTSCFRYVRLAHIAFEFLTSRSILDYINSGASGRIGSRWIANVPRMRENCANFVAGSGLYRRIQAPV